MAAHAYKQDATKRIDDHIAGLPDWSRKICQKLRNLVLKSDPEMIEDWKWGPNYSVSGMVCGIIASKKYVSLVFFKGTRLKDKQKILQGNPHNLNIRSFRFAGVNEIDEDIVLEYLFEAIDNNRKGIKPVRGKDKKVLIPPFIQKAFKKSGVLKFFETRSYSHRKNYVDYISVAKKEETRQKRLEKAVDTLRKRMLTEITAKR
jgi:hypothetical protein